MLTQKSTSIFLREEDNFTIIIVHSANSFFKYQGAHVIRQAENALNFPRVYFINSNWVAPNQRWLGVYPQQVERFIYRDVGSKPRK